MKFDTYYLRYASITSMRKSLTTIPLNITTTIM